MMMMMMVVMEELGRGKGLTGIVRSRRVDRDRRALRRMQLGAHLVVQPAEHGAVSHAEVVALRQGHRARRAREAAHVKHEVPGAHHQLGRQDRRLAARAPLHAAEHPANRKNEERVFFKGESYIFDILNCTRAPQKMLTQIARVSTTRATNKVILYILAHRQNEFLSIRIDQAKSADTRRNKSRDIASRMSCTYIRTHIPHVELLDRVAISFDIINVP